MPKSSKIRPNKLQHYDIKNLAAKLPRSIFAVLLKICRVGQGVKTPPFHGGITGSNPVRGTNKFFKPLKMLSFNGFFISGGREGGNVCT